jgi:hypothetical protein
VDIDSTNETDEEEAIRCLKSAHKALAVRVHNFADMIDFNGDFANERVFKYFEKAAAMVLKSEKKIEDKEKWILSHSKPTLPTFAPKFGDIILVKTRSKERILNFRKSYGC